MPVFWYWWPWRRDAFYPPSAAECLKYLTRTALFWEMCSVCCAAYVICSSVSAQCARYCFTPNGYFKWLNSSVYGDECSSLWWWTLGQMRFCAVWAKVVKSFCKNKMDFILSSYTNLDICGSSWVCRKLRTLCSKTALNTLQDIV